MSPIGSSTKILKYGKYKGMSEKDAIKKMLEESSYEEIKQRYFNRMNSKTIYIVGEK